MRAPPTWGCSMFAHTALTGFLKSENADSQSGRGTSSLAALTAAHVAVDAPEKVRGQRLQPSMEGRQRTHRKTWVDRRSLQDRGRLEARKVVLDGPQHSKERSKTMSPATRLGKEDASPARDISARSPANPLYPAKRLGNRNRVLPGENTLDQRTQRRASSAQRQRQRRAPRIQVLRIGVPVCDDVCKVGDIGKACRIPALYRLLESGADVAELTGELLWRVPAVDENANQALKELP